MADGSRPTTIEAISFHLPENPHRPRRRPTAFANTLTGTDWTLRQHISQYSFPNIFTYKHTHRQSASSASASASAYTRIAVRYITIQRHSLNHLFWTSGASTPDSTRSCRLWLSPGPDSCAESSAVSTETTTAPHYCWFHPASGSAFCFRFPAWRTEHHSHRLHLSIVTGGCRGSPLYCLPWALLLVLSFESTYGLSLSILRRS